MIKMRHQQRSTILSQNGISEPRFDTNLHYALGSSAFETIQPNQKPELTSAFKDINRRAVDRTRSRGETEVTDSDVLIGLAEYAEDARQRFDAETAAKETAT